MAQHPVGSPGLVAHQPCTRWRLQGAWRHRGWPLERLFTKRFLRLFTRPSRGGHMDQAEVP